jgi:hypothetical protein
MELKPIDIKSFTTQVYGLFEVQWMLLTSGDFDAGKFNSMTISWGSMGVMWGRPFAQVVVRPVRYTYQFMETYDTFTLTAFPRQYHKALSLLGTASGRDGDKIAQSGLTPVASSCVAAPGFAEAELVIECRKITGTISTQANSWIRQLTRTIPTRIITAVILGKSWRYMESNASPLERSLAG